MAQPSLIKPVLILCCHCLAVGRLEALLRVVPNPTPFFALTALSTPSSPSPKSSSPRTVAAAVMAPDDGGVGPASARRPNWRVVDVRGGNGGAAGSPFCHPLPAGESDDDAAAVSAPWSNSAYEEAVELYERMRLCDDPYLAPVLTTTLDDLEMAYRLYGPFCTVGSYNGGKDAVVIFHLMRAVHAKYCGEMRKVDEGCMIPRPRVIYFRHPDEFPEVLTLLHRTVEQYDVDMLAFKEGVSFGEGLKYLVERNIAPGKNGLSFQRSSGNFSPPHPLAFILGTRKDDPNAGSQGTYAPSSHYMPPFLRVNPILDWTYGQVWHFLRLYEFPYCSLYDDGYTSLGNVKDTLPCPVLKKGGEEGEGYWPAYMLRDWGQERAGRFNKKKEKQNAKEGSSDVGSTESDVSKPSEVTLSQTSSTVSLPLGKRDTAKSATESMSTIFNAAEEASAGDKEAGATAPIQFASAGRPAVGLIVIGDELLKGMTPDANILAAAKALRSNNISLSRVSVISDDGQEIVNEIRRFRKELDVVITSGGVGPTHDDITIKSVAEALCLDMEMHCEMAELLLEKMGSNDSGEKDSNDGDVEVKDRRKSLTRQMSEAQRKMSMLPTTSVLQYLAEDAGSDEWPLLRCENVFVLPGVPSLFENNINRLAAYLPIDESQEEDVIGLDVDQPSRTEKRPAPPPRSDTYRIVLSLDEDAIVSALNASVAAHPHVSFGSYPIADDPGCKTIVTLEGRFYNGGYAKGSQRLLEKSRLDGADRRAMELFFSKEEMDRNVARALEDLKVSLPAEGIVCIDNCDDLLVMK